MGSNQTNEVSANFSIQNDLFQITEDSCKATCTAIQSGTTVIINNSTVIGGITLSNQCNANVACVMNQQLTSNVTNIMSSMIKQTQEAESSFFSFVAKNQSKHIILQYYTNKYINRITLVCIL